MDFSGVFRFLLSTVGFAERQEPLHAFSRHDNPRLMRDPRIWGNVEPARDAAWLAPLWRVYVESGHTVLGGLGKDVRIAPVLMEDYATGDLIAGTTAVDVKASGRIHDNCRTWIRQATGYALVDETCDRAGIYQARHGVFVSWELRALLETDDHGLHLARGDFTQVAERAAARKP